MPLIFFKFVFHIYIYFFFFLRRIKKGNLSVMIDATTVKNGNQWIPNNFAIYINSQIMKKETAKYDQQPSFPIWRTIQLSKLNFGPNY